MSRRLSPAPQAFVGVDPLVGDRADLRAVMQQARDELPAHLAELVGRPRLMERVAVALEQRQVGVHA